MQVIKFFFIVTIIATVFGCEFDTIETTNYEPVYITRDALESSFRVDGPRNIYSTGKIYYRYPFLAMVEPYEGVHIFDNTNPKSPKPLAFLKILGCIDIAVKDNALYADNTVDLLVLDISDINNISVAKRVKNVFPKLTPPDIDFIPNEYTNLLGDDTYILRWEEISTN